MRWSWPSRRTYNRVGWTVIEADCGKSASQGLWFGGLLSTQSGHSIDYVYGNALNWMIVSPKHSTESTGRASMRLAAHA